MRNLFSTIAILCFAAGSLWAQNNNSTPFSDTDIKKAILQLVADYPEATLQDVYKSFYQAHFGPEHFISDTASVHQYLIYEIEVAKTDIVPAPYYEPTGANGEYIRVHLRCVAEGKVSAETLFHAFIDSKRNRCNAIPWVTEWQKIIETIDRMDLPSLADEELRKTLDEYAQIDQAVRHSEQYRQAYHPHYRIVRKDIFEQSIKPHIQ